MPLPRLTLRGRLLAAFGLMTGLLLAMALAGLAIEQRGDAAFRSYVAQTEARVQLAGRLLDAANARAIAARNLVLATDPATVQAERAAALHAQATLQAALHALAGQAAAPEAATLLARLQDVERRYRPLALAIIDSAAAGQRAAAAARLQAECRPLLAELVAAAGAYADWARQAAQAAALDAGAHARRDRALLLGAAAAGLLVALALGWSVTHSLARALDAAVQVARQVADGDLSAAPAAAQRQDETGQLLADLARMHSHLAAIVTRVRGCSDRIVGGATDIADGNSALAARNLQQARQLAAVSAATAGISGHLRDGASRMREAAVSADQARRAAEQGGAVVQQVVQTMAAIRNDAGRMADIVGVIDGLAFQTNLLALNAAVEAARAGPEGRGFAVVAGEVGALARRSAAAAQQIQAVITSSRGRVEAGVALVQVAGDAMVDIVAGAQTVSGAMADIHTANARQQQAVCAVDAAMERLDASTQHNAALVETTASAASTLRAEADALAAAVGAFRLSGGAPAAGTARSG